MIFVQVGSTIRFPNTSVVVTKRTTGQPDPDEPLRGFGTHFELDLPLDSAAEMIVNHTTMMPQWLFQTIGWTETELLRYASPASWNAEIMPKVTATWQALNDLRERIESQGAAALNPPATSASSKGAAS